MTDVFNPASIDAIKNALTDDEEFRVLIFGDWHMTDKPSKVHVDYEQNCYDCMSDSIRIVEEKKPHIILHSGDITGRDNDKNVYSRDFLAGMHIWFQRLAQEAVKNASEFFKGKLPLDYVAQAATAGNHDFGSRMTDFEYFKMVGAFEHQKYIDVEGMRIHFIDYGFEQEKLEIAEGKFNLALAHNEFHVERKTNWFMNSAKGIELSKLRHWKGIDFVAGGHIHGASMEIIKTSIEGHTVNLFYMGCGTRPDSGERYKVARPLLFKVSKRGVEVEIIEWKLPENIFKDEQDSLEDTRILELLETFSGSEEANERLHNREELSETLGSLTKYMIAGNSDFLTQLQIMGAVDKEALQLAMSTIENVNLKNSGLGKKV